MTDIQIQQYQKVLDKALETQDDQAIIAAYIELGQAYLEIKDMPKGFTQFDQALKVAEKAKDQHAETRLLGLAGICLKHLGNYDAAMQSFRKSLRTAKKIEDQRMECDALYQIGALLVDQDESLEAISHLDNALLLSLQIQDHKRKLAITNQMGNIFLTLESVDKAIENYATALDTAQTLGDKEAEAASRIHLGQTFLLDDDYQAAIENFELGLEIADQVDSPTIEMQALYGLTQASDAVGRNSLAIIYGEQVVNKAQQVSATAEEVQAIQTLVGILNRNKQYTKAITYLERGVLLAQAEQSHDWELRFLTDKGLTHYLNDALEEASQAMEKAYEITVRFQQQQEEAFIAGRQASILADLGELEASNEKIQRSIQLAEALELPLLKGEQLVLKALNARDLDENVEAVEYLDEALVLYQEIEREDLQKEIEALRKDLLS